MTPHCAFCDKLVYSSDKYVLDDHWYHELCWWKKECARLTAVIDELKGRDSGDSVSSEGERHAQHDLGSEPTVIAVQTSYTCEADVWEDEGGK